MLLIILISAIFIRYLLFSFSANSLAKSSGKAPVVSLKRKGNQVKKEVANSFMSSVLFGLGIFGLYHCWKTGVITTADGYAWWYHPISVVGALLMHETYYYWLHRLMHHPTLYKYLHQGHHDSVVVSSWTSFSFDGLETVLQILALYLIAFIIPLHLYSVAFIVLFMSVSATINHLNYEVYPKFLMKYFIGATHHAYHHREFRTNYGLYFTFWDKWMNTESRNYQKTIDDERQ